MELVSAVCVTAYSTCEQYILATMLQTHGTPPRLHGGSCFPNKIWRSDRSPQTLAEWPTPATTDWKQQNTRGAADLLASVAEVTQKRRKLPSPRTTSRVRTHYCGATCPCLVWTQQGVGLSSTMRKKARACRRFQTICAWILFVMAQRDSLIKVSWRNKIK